MNNKNKIANLERSIARYYDRYSAKRVAVATLLVGLGSLSAAFLVFYLFDSALFAGLACLLTGFVLTNVCFFTIVPPARSLEATKEMICAAIHDSSRIVAYDKQKVQLKDQKGRVHTLKPRDMVIWSNQVVPHLIAGRAAQSSEAPRKTSRKLTASERKYIEERRKEVLEMEKSIAEERKRIEADRKELEARTADLNEAEEVVISRMYKVEEAEAELEQLKIAAAERVEADAATLDPEVVKAKEAELKSKEAELVSMRKRLAEDRKSLDEQKSQMERLKESTTQRAPNAKAKTDTEEGVDPVHSIEAREAALEARMKELEAAAQDIEERAMFVTESENSLIERLDELSHREATIEQSEIDAGVRKD
ncbi:MAG: hypothetical protein GVY36_00175 [Verrucomicrobia bacterium]|jgi:DNA repair exonuclease SbcCD ATPase subunit|nr:hypothetical protein [Verrucomicrobiota bacterium]